MERKPIRLRKQEHAALTEALRRRTRFISDPSGGPEITKHWTGLGPVTYYRQAVQSGYMEAATGHNPRCSTWWRLTERGARIVAYWLGLGYSYQRIENGELPPALIPAEVM